MDVSPEDSTGRALANELVDSIQLYQSENAIKILGGDGCPVNTGRDNGAIHLCEIELKRPLHWAICLLHLNELIMKNFFKNLDGGTVGDVGFRGSLGKELTSLSRDRKLVDFEVIPGKL
jgi:hypothetical protein